MTITPEEIARLRELSEKAKRGAGLVVVNLFAARATDPRLLSSFDDPVGHDNDTYIRQAAEHGAEVICGWGSHPAARTRAAEVSRIIRNAGKTPCCLGVTASGAPRHPLYLRGDAVLRLWPEPHP